MPHIKADLIEILPFRRTAGGAVELLMLRRVAEDEAMGGTWHAVHGRVERGESAVAAAVRELREETGLTPLRMWQLPDLASYYVADSDTVLLQPVFAAEVTGDAQVVLSPEHTEFRWIAAPDAPLAFMWPCQRRAVAQLMEEIIRPGLAEPHLRLSIDAR